MMTAERYVMQVMKGRFHLVDDEEQAVCFDCGSSADGGGLSSSEALSLSLRSDVAGGHGYGSKDLDDDDEDEEEEDNSSSAEDFSSTWSSVNIMSKCFHKPIPTFPAVSASDLRKKAAEVSEVDMMKEKFSKLLLGEDMSGGGKGVCSALAISNAITNLSASVFGELWRLEPLPAEKKSMWRREMEWLLSVADHIVEFVPSRQTLKDGSNIEVMVTRPRSDIHVNLPALKKLDGMLLDALDEFRSTEFWYADHQGSRFMASEGGGRQQQQRQDDKWWLPMPMVPLQGGLSKHGLKQLQHQRECVNQILKAAIAINTHILSEMEIPDIYFDALPKNVKTSLGDVVYKQLASESFYPDAILDMLDLCSEHKAVDIANRIEAAIHILQRQQRTRSSNSGGGGGSSRRRSRKKKHDGKSSWGLMKDFMADMEKKDFLAGRAESLLLCLKQRFPNLRQTLLDITKIQHNKDVGQALLESYSRVLESLAFNISARIEDVLCTNNMGRQVSPPPAAVAVQPPYPRPRMMMVKTTMPPLPPSSTSLLQQESPRRGCSFDHSLLLTPHGTPLATPSASPTPSSSPRRTMNSPLHSDDESPDYLAYAYEYENVGIVRVVPAAMAMVAKIQASPVSLRGLDEV